MATAAEQMARNMNFGTFAKAKDLQARILFTLFILVLLFRPQGIFGRQTA